ncbi:MULTISPECIES: hypothetical protein [Streptomyces]|uniref:Uncharacterized protein n=1 Tax=Streptomyces dengpaensis TaxID=2049881 RepID=A0ABN5HXA0_9ACTN|nr:MULTISPECIES: hypothetical protein [Streptomyces]AVH55737.1 hypothetical protein C4B68_08095 [Streptomyces dengpaensis]PIB11997.1 hypothetical protein B1C81_02040 [Streptomyces sp. HG99]
MAVLLYYPLVTPPTEIVHQALLYWDGVASVVPRESEIYDAAVSPDLKDLRRRGLYTPLTFDRRSMEVLQDPEYRGAFRGNSASQVLMEELHRLSRNRDRWGLVPNSVIYGSKMSYWLERELLRLDLAVPNRERGFWSLTVPTEVWQLIIGVTVRELACGDRASYVPYTENDEAYRWALRAPAQDRVPAWEVELGKLLPVPAPGTATADVLAFRERYDDERLRLMRALHRMLGDLRRDYDHPADVLAQLEVELKQAAKDYRGAAKSSRMAWVNRSVTVTVGVAAAAVGALVIPDFGWLLGAGSGYAINVATREIRPLSRARDDHDFSYVHRVEQGLS